MRRLAPLVATLLVACLDGAEDAACRCPNGAACAPNGQCIGTAPARLEAPPCSSCSWAFEVCIETAKGETLRALADERCPLLLCLVLHHKAVEACEESYVRCAASCVA